MAHPEDVEIDAVASSTTLTAEEASRRRCQQALLWERYLHEDHTPKQLAAWCKRLNVFRFCRAYGGHANDGDQLLAALALNDDHALHATCEALGIPLERMPDERDLMTTSLNDRPRESKAFPGWRQPGHVVIAGSRLYAMLTSHLLKDQNGRLTGESIPCLTLSICDPIDVWNVTDAAVAHAEAVERLIQPFAGQIIDPPQDDRNCISPKYYPEMFGLWHRVTAEWPWRQEDPR